MTKFFKPLKVKKSVIDLRSIGAQEQHEEAIYRMHATDHATRLADERGDLVELIGQPEYTAPLPKPYTPYKLTAKEALRVVKGMIIREVLALRP